MAIPPVHIDLTTRLEGVTVALRASTSLPLPEIDVHPVPADQPTRLHRDKSSKYRLTLSTSDPHLLQQARDELVRCTRADPVPSRRKPGRPPDSGTYPSAEEFLRDVRPILQQLQRDGRHPSQESVARLLPIKTTTRQLQRWVHKYLGLSWTEFLKSE